jgi:hypothetical protein
VNAPQLPKNPMGADEQAPMMQTGLPTNPSPNQTTTKPRQVPGNGGGIDFDPASNGGDVQVGQDSALPGTPETDAPGSTPSPEAPDKTAARLAAIANDIRRDNPSLSPRSARRIAEEAYDQYLSKEADWANNPLGFVDWMEVGDGPVTRGLAPKQPRRPEGPQGKGEPREPEEVLGEPEHREFLSDEDEWDSQWGGYESPAESHEQDSTDLSEWDRLPNQTPVQRERKQKAGPAMKRLMKEHGPDIARALWQMRKR